MICQILIRLYDKIGKIIKYITNMDGRAMDNAKVYTQKVKNTGQENTSEKQEEVSQWKPLPSTRKFPLWLRSIIFLILVVISLCAGLMVGYSVVGDGESATTIFHKDIWEHILSFFK